MTPRRPEAQTSRHPDAETPNQIEEGPATMHKMPLTTTQKAVLALAIVPMIAVGVAGGIGTYSNISHAYGSGTAIGALAAGEGATAVLALLLLGLTLLGQSAPFVIRAGLWALPGAAAVMAATAADDGLGQTIVYALTPMAITASAEGLAFLVRRIVVHTEGRDVEAETRAAAVVRSLAYQQARAASHPSRIARKLAVRRSWRLARRVGEGDTELGAQLLGVQRTRMVAGADVALERMFTPAGTGAVPALPEVSADSAPALPAASAGGAATPGDRDAGTPIVRAETRGYPAHNPTDQAEEDASVRPDLTVVRAEKAKRPSIAADVRQMVSDGVQDVRHIVDAIAARHGREADDPRLKSTVTRYWRQARAQSEAADVAHSGQYL